MEREDDEISVHISHFNFIFRLNCVYVTMKMLYESCNRFTQDSSAANENGIEFPFDFRMSKSEKKGVENGVDAHTQ